MTIDKFHGYGVPITLNKPDDFLKVKETLTRIGIGSDKTMILNPSCYILHKQGTYAILHFKELFELDGKRSDLTAEDIGRRNTICRLLGDWGLLTVVDPGIIRDPAAEMRSIKIVSFANKRDWQIIDKYEIGARH
jgi:hypothetical protein